jgi:hypothetical protein
MGKKSNAHYPTGTIYSDSSGWKALFSAVVFRAVQDYLKGIVEGESKCFWEAKAFLFSEHCKDLLILIGIAPDKAMKNLKKTANDLKKGKPSLVAEFVAKKRRHTFKSKLLLQRIQAGNNGDSDKSLLQHLQ